MKPILFCITAIFLCSGCDLGLTESWPLKEWTVDEYKIVYYKMLGPFGPPYDTYRVYKDNENISGSVRFIDNDTCKFLFREENDYYVEFNLCTSTKTVIEPTKIKLKSSNIDSVTIRPYSAISLKRHETDSAPFYDTIVNENFDSTISKKLTNKQIKHFARSFNKSEVNGYKRLGKGYDYLITVYTKSGVRRIKTLNNYITEDELWSFETSVEKDYFDSLWE